MATFLRLYPLIVLLSSVAATASAERDITIDRDVVYGHKVGMALTYDVVRPQRNANGRGILFMVSGGWFSPWFPPENVFARSRSRRTRGRP